MDEHTDLMSAYNYVLAQDSVEQSRLSSQYKFTKRVLDREAAVPNSINLNNVTNILDVASGSLSWIFDLLSSPDIRARVSKSSSQAIDSKPIKLYACDITDAKFPSPDVLQPYGVTTFLQDVTKPFPDDMKEYFDLVHMRYVRFSLKEAGWELALQNLSNIIKPGGILYLAETDNTFYGPSSQPPQPGEPHDIEVSVRGKTWVHRLNAIYTFVSRKNNHIPDPSYRLPALLKKSGFSIKDFQRNLTPFGKLCLTYKGLKGSSLADETVSSTENLRLITELLIKDLFVNDELSLALGYSITSETACEELLQEIISGCEQEGCSLILAEYVALNGNA